MQTYTIYIVAPFCRPRGQLVVDYILYAAAVIRDTLYPLLGWPVEQEVLGGTHVCVVGLEIEEEQPYSFRVR